MNYQRSFETAAPWFSSGRALTQKMSHPRNAREQILRGPPPIAMSLKPPPSSSPRSGAASEASVSRNSRLRAPKGRAPSEIGTLTTCALSSVAQLFITAPADLQALLKAKMNTSD